MKTVIKQNFAAKSCSPKTMGNNNRGYTLLELIIAMTLGLVIIAGAIQTLISNKQTFSLTDAIGSTEEGGRFSMYFLTQDIRMAGYTSNAQTTALPPFYAKDPQSELDVTCDASADWCSKEGINTGNDQISILKEMDDLISVDCNGNPMVSPTNKGNVLANVYWIENDKNNDNLPSLFCRGYDRTAAMWLGAEALPMVGGVESFQVLYGEVNNNGETRYVSLDRVQKITQIIAVKIGVLVAENGDGSLDKKSRSYNVLDTGPYTYNDKKNRTLYSTTVFLSNAKLYDINQGLGY